MSLALILTTNQLLYSLPLSGLPVTEEIETSVVILGGGLAGVFALERFQNLGLNDIVLVEGRDMLGGRLQSTTFANHTIELGANWKVKEISNSLTE
ncbi:Polyamine oxidase [Neolecta irregularis DAH-3]|uniref:Polyamine oxidase n=1 Tax=Neolecta irregularis (strain DAH-3) TaxID=1198029 RepID=A0A1U7LLM9_NEOID|nr:Polyamine oxidase [Neolecta irregularis DAH-3]|eukprot:OLL23565.1 Polyamine oxidase [Neolecta irregularis DAH-3]